MSRELLILRHAKSDWGSGATTDFERPLNKRGKHDAPRLGRWLHQQGLIPDRVISSPARRAKQTVQRVCHELGIDPETIVWEPRIYEAELAALLGALATHAGEARRVLLVGHNPGLDHLLRHLVPDAPVNEDGKLLTTAALARVELPDDWQNLSQGSGVLRQMVRPRDLGH